MKWVTFSIEMGRLVARSSRAGQIASVASGNEVTGEQQSFEVSVRDTAQIVRYEEQSPQLRLVVEFNGQRQVVIRREPRGQGMERFLQFRQTDEGPVTLETGDDANPERISGPSLWHIWFQNPQLCERELQPILLKLRRDWDPAATSAQVEAAMYITSFTDDTQKREQWKSWVAKLDSAAFVEREEAERELGAAGLAVYPFLQSLDSRRLSREQQERIRHLLDGLASAVPDSPERACDWLHRDRHAWLALLASDRVDRRQAAKQRLERLMGSSLDFDALADVELRRKQFQGVEKRLAVR